MDPPHGHARSGESWTALLPSVLDHSPVSATDPAPESEISASNDISDNAALFVTHHVSYDAQKLTSGPTTVISSSGALEITVISPVDKDASLNTHKVLPCDHKQSSACDMETPGPVSSQTSGALLPPLCPIDTLAGNTSSSHVVQTSGIFMGLTPPPSSPPTECDISFAERLVRDGEADCSSSPTEIDGYPEVTMSSPNLVFREDELLSSPPPRHQTTKRAQCDESDEVRCQNTVFRSFMMKWYRI